MSWHDHVSGLDPLTEAFGAGSLPTSPGDLARVVLEDGGATVLLTFDGADLPSPRPAAWHADVTHVQLVLRAEGVTGLVVEVEPGEPAELTATTALEPADGGLALEVTGEAVRIAARATDVRLERFSAYQRD